MRRLIWFLHLTLVFLLLASANQSRVTKFSQIPKEALAKVKQLASDIDDVVVNVQTWMKEKLKKDITQEQSDNVRAIATQYFLTDYEQGIKFERIWYVIAISYWESTLRALTEYRSHNYGSYIWDVQNRYFYTEFQGRGFCQTTWRGRYETFSRILGVDLVVHKDMVNNPKYNAQILVTGMWKGLFTGLGLRDFISQELCDYYDARKIINPSGTDHPLEIATYANDMHEIWGKQTRKCQATPKQIKPLHAVYSQVDKL